jgi:hypothetical protein
LRLRAELSIQHRKRSEIANGFAEGVDRPPLAGQSPTIAADAAYHAKGTKRPEATLQIFGKLPIEALTTSTCDGKEPMNEKVLDVHARDFGKVYALMLAAVLTVGSMPAAQANDHTVTVGVEKITIPAVSGLDDYTTDPKSQQIAAPLIESNAQLLSFQARLDSAPRYLIVKVPKAIVGKSISTPEFRTFTAYSRSNLKNLERYSDVATQQATEKIAHFNRTLAPMHFVRDIEFGAPTLVSIDRDDDFAFTRTEVVPMQFQIDGQPKTSMVVMCASAILVKGKFVIAQLFGPIKKIEWTRSTCNKFVTDFAMQNK